MIPPHRRPSLSQLPLAQTKGTARSERPRVGPRWDSRGPYFRKKLRYSYVSGTSSGTRQRGFALPHTLISAPRDGSDVVLINEPPPASNEPEAADLCFWWRVELYLQHGLAVLVAIRSARMVTNAWAGQLVQLDKSNLS